MRGTGGGNVLAYDYMDDGSAVISSEARVDAGHYTRQSIFSPATRRTKRILEGEAVGAATVG